MAGKLQELNKDAVFFRSVWKGNADDPLKTRSETGRYHTRLDMDSTVYLAADQETAELEVAKRWGSAPEEYVLVKVKVELSHCVDLTAPDTQKQLKTSEDALAGKNWRECQHVAADLRARGFEAAWTYSSADRPDGRCLVIFTENFKKGSRFEVF